MFAPGSRKKILERRVARRPWAPLACGERLRMGGRVVLVASLTTRLERHGDEVEHVTEVFTRTRRGRAPEPGIANVVAMPTRDGSTIEQFLWLHALVRRFDGDADAWLDDLRARGVSERDLRFVRTMRSRLRRDPRLIVAIRKMVDATPLRLSAGGGRL